MVKRSYCCCCCDLKFDIPAGLTTLEENCGKSTGIMRPGAHWCYCSCKRVACMLTRAIVNYDAPVSTLFLFSSKLIDIINRFITVPQKITLISRSICIFPLECQHKQLKLRTLYTNQVLLDSMNYSTQKSMRILELSLTAFG